MNVKLGDEKNPFLWPSTTVTFVLPDLCKVPVWSLLFILYFCLNKALSMLFIHTERQATKHQNWGGLLQAGSVRLWLYGGCSWGHCGGRTRQQKMKRGQEVRVAPFCISLWPMLCQWHQAACVRYWAVTGQSPLSSQTSWWSSARQKKALWNNEHYECLETDHRHRGDGRRELRIWTAQGFSI